jgi:uncharacterized protein YodC (DUF2158 family)
MSVHHVSTEAQMAFKPDDVVRLKSGGRAMTVDKVGRIGNDERVFCTWFEGKDLKQANFAPATLEEDFGPTIGPTIA